MNNWVVAYEEEGHKVSAEAGRSESGRQGFLHLHCIQQVRPKELDLCSRRPGWVSCISPLQLLIK